MSVPAISLHGISKSFGANRALDDVSFKVEAGSVHALLGENGAGKSTAMKILSGLIVPDRGSMKILGQEMRFRSARDAQMTGIRTAFQELTLIPDLTVLDNYLLTDTPITFAGTLGRRREAEGVRAQFDHLGIHVDLHATVDRLDLPTRQKIEIARTLYRKPRILLLDEPTSALAGRDVAWLGDIIAKARADGVTVLFISHRLPEVRDFCETMTILRNGQHIATDAVDRLSDDEVIKLIIGRSLDQTFPAREMKHSSKSTAPTLSLDNLRAGDKLHSIDLELHAGEIVGVAGLQGMGQRDLFNVCFGAEPVADGTISVDGQVVQLTSPSDALHSSLRIGFLPEDRKSEGLFQKLNGKTNVSLPTIDTFIRWGLIDKNAERAATQKVFSAVDVAPTAGFKSVEDFSGGNQQKIAIAKWLLAESRILLLFDPTRGIDVGTKHQLYELMRAFANAGGTILFYSTEVPELVHLCDRVVVLYEGKIVDRMELEELSETRIMNAVLGTGTSRAEQAR